jgi:predicted benzoate:H+ symporter BenE
VGALLIGLGILCALPGIELIYEAWNLPAHAPSPVSIAGFTLGHRQACGLFLIPATVLVLLGVATAMSYRRPD